jgi:hypothetical protein
MANRQADAIHRAHKTGGRLKADDQILNFKKWSHEIYYFVTASGKDPFGALVMLKIQKSFWTRLLRVFDKTPKVLRRSDGVAGRSPAYFPSSREGIKGWVFLYAID